MNLTPKMIHSRDQLDAAVRDRYDRKRVDIYDTPTRLAILHTISMLCDVATSFKDQPEDLRAEMIVVGISQALDSIVRTLEVGQ